jgi:hypothetical protein
LRRKRRATALSPERDSSMRHEVSAAASASVVSPRMPAIDHLRHQELVVVPKRCDELPLGEELAVLHRAEVLQHLHHADELLPVRVAQRFQRLPLEGEA